VVAVSLYRMFYSSINLLPNNTISFIFMAEKYSIVYISHN
jgi:hypothetical protein